MARRLVYILIASCCWFASMAQTVSDDPIKDAIDYIARGTDVENIDIEDLSIQLETFLQNPLFINDARSKKLESLPLLSDFQIESIADYIKANGQIKTENELQYIPGFDIETAKVIAPFIRFDSPQKNRITKDDFRYAKQSVTTRYMRFFQRADGYSDTTSSQFYGDPNYYSLGYDLAFGQSVYMYMRAEKDAGEKAPIDSFSGSVLINSPVPYVSKIIVGDYKHNIGQGLLLWSGFTTGKNSNPATLRKRAAITPYKSYNESFFNRGAAIETYWHNFRLSASISRRDVDGRVSSINPNSITVLTTGLHRTESERDAKGDVAQHFWAGSLSYQLGKHNFAINHFYKENSLGDLKEKEEGSSIDFYGNFKYLSYFGEVATDHNSNIAQYYGLNLKVSPKTVVTGIYRNYPKEFEIESNNSFGESSNACNEEGVYLGISITPKYQFTISGYADMFKSRYPKYRVSQPSSGSEAGICVSGYLTKKFEPRFKISHKTKELDITQPSGNFALTEQTKKLKADLLLKYHYTEQIEFSINGSTTRYSTFSSAPQTGYLLYANIKYGIVKPAITLYARYSVFDADTWDVALYCYENDLPGFYSVNSFYQKGSNAYFMASAKINRRLKLWLKVAQIYYAPPVQGIGSGSDYISGNKKTSIKMQATINF